MKIRINKVKNIINKLLLEEDENQYGSIVVYDQQIIEEFIYNTFNTFLVSFPRTGSHWLRMIMELYFSRPSLVRVFYYPEIKEYLTLHTHDIDLSVERENVIYLYRDPVDTVYSQMNYYKENIHDTPRIIYWADLYGRHLDKWLYSESFTKKKAIITYEGMRRDLLNEFGKITDYFGCELDRKRLLGVAEKITKEEVKKKTGHDPQVMQLTSEYADIRNEFRRLYRELILDTLLKGRAHLSKYL